MEDASGNEKLRLTVAAERAEERAEKRRGGRVRVQDVKSNQGEVVNISGGGVKVRTRRAWEDGERRIISLKAGSHCVSLAAKCTWREQTGPRQWIIGLEFGPRTREQERIIKEIARAYTVRRILFDAA